MHKQCFRAPLAASVFQVARRYSFYSWRWLLTNKAIDTAPNRLLWNLHESNFLQTPAEPDRRARCLQRQKFRGNRSHDTLNARDMTVFPP